MFGYKRKTIKRNQIPQNKDSLWLYDNYDEVIKHFADRSVVTDAIFDENVRNIVLFNLKRNGVM